MPWTKEEKYFVSLLIWRQNQNCLKMDATHKYDNGLLPRQETKKIACPGSRYIKNLKKHTDLMSLVQRMHFYRMFSK